VGQPTSPPGAAATVSQKMPGHLSINPILGDMAFIISTTPQVSTQLQYSLLIRNSLITPQVSTQLQYSLLIRNSLITPQVSTQLQYSLLIRYPLIRNFRL